MLQSPKAPYVRLRIERAASSSFSRADIIGAVRREYASGRLPAGSRMPPVRVLQHQLGISKNTAQEAYEELIADGVLTNRKRLGYFVDAPRKHQRIHTPTPASIATIKMSFAAVAPARAPRQGRKPIDLGSVFIERDILPMQKLAQCFRAVLRDSGLRADYDRQGFAPLRHLIAQRLVKRGIPARADDVIITTGSQQALDIVTRALDCKAVATESPAYGIAKLLFEMNQMRVSALPLDPFKGADLDRWRETIAAARPAIMYVTSSFQNPTGYSYSTAELMQLLELSQEFQCGIVEDDWGSDMLSFSEFRPPLRALGGEHVLYVNSFTKKLLPSLRIGYLLANEATREPLLAAKQVATLANPPIIDAVLYEFISRGYYDAHLRSLQAELDVRYKACLDALSATMPPEVRWTTPGGGPVLWLELPPRVDIQKLAAELATKDVRVDLRTASWFVGEPHLNGLRIGYASLPTQRLRQGLDLLGRAVKRALA
jgi:2-aminoadipate transaminase